MSTVQDINRYTAMANAEPEVATKITVNPQKDGMQAFFGKDGPSFQDVLDTINPLKHIPVISDLMESDNTTEKPSVGSKLAGGLLFGGPIGFVAALANEIFEEATGKGVASAAYAALSGSTPAATQVASAAPAAEQETETTVAANDTAVDAVSESSLAPIKVASLGNSSAAIGQQAQQHLASISSASDSGNDGDGSKKNRRDHALLDLYGASNSASQAYQKAQLMPYLREASTNQVM